VSVGISLPSVGGTLPARLCSEPPVRRIAGAAAIDGANNPFMLVRVTAVMAAVAGSLWAPPFDIAGILRLAFAIFFAFLGHAMLIFCKLGREQALALGLMVAQRNLGLMPAAMAGVLPSATWFYFALSQFPIYLTPQLSQPIAHAKMA
jgi:BASS family bile acid:Na+ symporter